MRSDTLSKFDCLTCYLDPHRIKIKVENLTLVMERLYAVSDEKVTADTNKFHRPTLMTRSLKTFSVHD